MWIVIAIIVVAVIVWLCISSSGDEKQSETKISGSKQPVTPAPKPVQKPTRGSALKQSVQSVSKPAPKQRRQAPSGLPYKRMSISQKTMTPGYRSSHPTQCKFYDEVLTFDGCYSFASADELVVKFPDGTAFISPLRHYESDYFTETYVGKDEDGQQFRFLFASPNHPMAQIKPMVTFASMATDGWAVHFDVR